MEKKKLNKIKNILVIAFIAIYLICTYFTLRGEYLECLELGEQYVQNFWTNIKYKYSIMGISFVVISICMFITNIGIKKGLKPFFESENKTMPKLPNKSLIFVVAIIGSIIFSNNIVLPGGALQRKNEALPKNFLSKVQFFSFISLNFLEHKTIDFCA